MTVPIAAIGEEAQLKGSLIFGEAPEGELNLEKIFDRIDAYHPSLRSSELNRQAAKAYQMEARSAFIPKILSRPLLLEDYLNESYKRKRAVTSAGEVIWQTPFAVQFIGSARATTKPILADEGFNYNLSKATFDSSGKLKISSFSDADTTFGFRLPLARGLLIDENRADLKKAKLELSIADLNILQKRADLFSKAGEKYWDWVAAGEQYNVAKELLILAKFRAEATEERIKAGANPPIDFIEIQSQINSREENLAKARRNFEKESIGLSIYLWQSGEDFLTPTEKNIPESGIPEPVNIPETVWQDHLRASLSERPEYKILQFENKQEEINLRLARNEYLPIIDLEVLPTFDLNRFDDGQNWRGSIVAELPIYPLKAQSKVLKARTSIEKISLAQNMLKAQISNELRDALSYLNTTAERVRAAREARNRLKQLAEGEETRFEFGGSSLFMVNSREMAAAEAENKVIEALADHQKALIKYRYAIGEWSIPNFNDSWYQLVQNN